MIGTDGYLTAAQIVEMAESGYVRFGLHTHTHPDLTTLDEAGVRAELATSSAAIVDLLGDAPAAMAYSGGKHNAQVRTICGEYIAFAYTTAWPTKVPAFTPLTIPRYTVDRSASLADFCRMLGIT